VEDGQTGAIRTIDEHDLQSMRWLVSERTSDQRPESGSIGERTAKQIQAEQGNPAALTRTADRGSIGRTRASTTQIRRPQLRRGGIVCLAFQEGVDSCGPTIGEAPGIIAAAHPHPPRASGSLWPRRDSADEELRPPGQHVGRC
jgi:hypothetical protein